MKICIVAEGSYPYITGGVSSWIHQIISNMPEHEFVLITLMPEKTQQGKFKYALPPNVGVINELFLDELFQSYGRSNKKLAYERGGGRDQLVNLVSFSEVDWGILLDEFENSKKLGLNSDDVLMSEEFYNAVKEVYEKKFTHLGFTDFYWTIRSMYKMAFRLIMEEYPPADLYHAVSTGYAGLIAAVASNRQKTGFILTEHGIYTREREEELIKSEWLKGDLKELWINYFYQLSDCAYKTSDKVISLFERNKEIQVEIG